MPLPMKPANSPSPNHYEGLALTNNPFPGDPTIRPRSKDNERTEQFSRTDAAKKSSLGSRSCSCVGPISKTARAWPCFGQRETRKRAVEPERRRSFAISNTVSTGIGGNRVQAVQCRGHLRLFP